DVPRLVKFHFNIKRCMIKAQPSQVPNIPLALLSVEEAVNQVPFIAVRRWKVKVVFVWTHRRFNELSLRLGTSGPSFSKSPGPNSDVAVNRDRRRVWRRMNTIGLGAV